MVPIIADVVWPALYLEQRLFSLWAIGIGLLVEFLFVRRLTSLSPRMCLAADAAMNAASALIGIVLLPLAGYAWEMFPGQVVNRVLHVGTFNPVAWAATCILAVLINAVLESAVLRLAFRQKIGKRGFAWLCAANGISVALAYLSLQIWWPRG